MPNQVDCYQKVIDVIADARFDMDARLLLLEVAKRNPQAVLDAANATWQNRQYDNVASEVIRGVRDKGWTKIAAIKHARTMTGMGLKEAKDFVEDLNIDNLMYKNTHGGSIC